MADSSNKKTTNKRTTGKTALPAKIQETAVTAEMENAGKTIKNRTIQ